MQYISEESVALLDPSEIYLVDGIEPKREHEQTLFVTSPNYRLIKQFQKVATTVLYMPVWDLDELKDCNQLIYNMPEKDMEELFDLWGGVPRYIFGKDKQISRMEWQTAIVGLSNWSLAVILEAVGNLNLDDTIANRLLHFKVTDDFQWAHRIFASEKVAEALIEKRFEQLKQGELNQIISLSVSPPGGALRGILFEKYIHRLFTSIYMLM